MPRSSKDRDGFNKPVKAAIPDPTSDFRQTVIKAIDHQLESPEFIQQCRADTHQRGFTRKRKLPFKLIVIFLFQGLTRSIQRELNTFFQQITGSLFEQQLIDKSAFSHARKKLRPEAFKMLNTTAIDTFYANAPYKRWHGFRLLSIDGSTVMLPKHPSIEQEMDSHKYGRYADCERTLARLSLLYDVLNHVTLDAQFDRLAIGERDIAQRHLPYMLRGRDLLIMDRGYAGAKLFFALQERKIHFCVRLSSRWRDIAKMKRGRTEKIVNLRLKGDRPGPPAPGVVPKILTLRIVKIKLADGTIELLATSVLNPEKIAYNEFKDLYHQRWGIEENYKMLKKRLSLDMFSGKTLIAVEQDFYSKVFLMTTAAIMSFTVEKELVKIDRKDRRKHKTKINRTNSVSMVRRAAVTMLIHQVIEPLLQEFDRFLIATRDLLRPGRSFARKHLPQKPPCLNYKCL